MQTELETIRQKGLLESYNKACEEDIEAKKKLIKVTEVYSSYWGTDENPNKEKALKSATDAKTLTNKVIVHVIDHVFILYSKTPHGGSKTTSDQNNQGTG